jgi:hypothetical protein
MQKLQSSAVAGSSTAVVDPEGCFGLVSVEVEQEHDVSSGLCEWLPSIERSLECAVRVL